MTTTPTTLTARERLASQLDDILAGDPTDTDAAVTLQELIDEYSEDAVLDYIDNLHLKLDAADDWADQLRDDYIGEITAREYAEQLVEEGVFGDVAPALEHYIDYEKMADDLLMGDIWEGETGHLFRNS